MKIRNYRWALLAGLLVSSLLYAAEWSYTGATGPMHWAQLEPSFKHCAAGAEQSPIDIPALIATKNVPPLKLRYNFTHQVLYERYVHGAIEILLAKPREQNTLTWQRKTYQLVQFHFHSPSENHLAGKVFPMEGHFVHQAADGSLAVVGVFFNIGRANPSIAQILAARPLTSKNVNILAEQNFMVQALLPAERVFYAFKGSLTTPPCSEGVQWFLMQHPVELSAQQWAQLKQALPISNARPIQNRHGRAILLNTL